MRTEQDGPTWRCWVGRDVVKPKDGGSKEYVQLLTDPLDGDDEAQKAGMIRRANMIARALNEAGAL